MEGHDILQRKARPQSYETVAVPSHQYEQPQPEMFEFKGLEIYPNPASTSITIKNLRYAPDTFLELYDLSGHLIIKRNIVEMPEQTVDMNELENGIYLLRVSDKNIKLIISR
jgi:hypothetical protein